MPTPYDFTTTPPTAIALASFAPGNTPPTGIALASLAQTNVAPTGKTLADLTHANTPPAGIALPSLAQTNVAPTGKTLESFESTAGAPAGISIANFTPSTEPARALFKPGNTLALAQNETVNTPTLNIEGAVALNELYGQVRMPQACALTRLQVQLQDAPVGAAIIIELVKPNGTTLYNAQVTVPAGENFGETVFTTPIPFVANDDVRAKVTQIGSANAGGFGAVTLFTQLA